jgi:Leucine-rich repeat (LRR) protein
MTSLEELRIDNCKLTGTLPSQIADLPDLTTLDLSENTLQLGIPPGLFQIKSLRQVKLGTLCAVYGILEWRKEMVC